MRYRLLASAGLAAIALAAVTTARAEDCGCRDQVRAALARQAPVVAKPKPAPVRRAPARQPSCGPCTAPAKQAAVEPMVVAAEAGSEAGYDYRGQAPVDMYPYRQRWEVAPQGYVPPPQAYVPPQQAYAPPPQEYGDAMEYGPTAYGAPMAPPMNYGPSYGMAYGQSYGNGWALNYRPGLSIDQNGWFGGVGFAAGGEGGGGGGGGGMTLTLAQPDAANGYGPGYGGSYGAANQLQQWRADAFAPKASK